MTANFNRIIRHVESDYVILLPDDDLLRPEHLDYVTLGGHDSSRDPRRSPYRIRFH